ncbi:hypothetical protein ACFYVR_26250 [Rhodococcus sp. NPDC003318]|uniref:hypothetical protein n=1 Tax=Rhodococcus sp. NPDC003318 TaxID=3364503 RepID=UPI0036938768
MGYIDAKGRPEIVVNPAIKLGRAVYRPADEDCAPPAPPAPRTEKQRARAELKRAMAAERRAQQKAEGTTSG